MPLYEYQCKKCHHEFEIVQKFSDTPVRKCPRCGKTGVTKKISKTAFRLKGSGWFRDGYSKTKDGSEDSAKKESPCAECKHCPAAKSEK